MGADGFHDFVRELFAGLGPVQVKRMFGGAGVYAEGAMFALIATEAIYLKVDETLKVELKAQGCGPFVWLPKSGPRAGERVEMGYWLMPEAALDDPDLAAVWGRKALDAAKSKPKPRAKRKI